MSVAHIQLTCWQGGQNHSPSGISMSGGLKQAVWYPLSQESHSKIWGGYLKQSVAMLRLFKCRWNIGFLRFRPLSPVRGGWADRSGCRRPPLGFLQTYKTLLNVLLPVPLGSRHLVPSLLLRSAFVSSSGCWTTDDGVSFYPETTAAQR